MSDAFFQPELNDADSFTRPIEPHVNVRLMAPHLVEEAKQLGSTRIHLANDEIANFRFDNGVVLASVRQSIAEGLLETTAFWVQGHPRAAKATDLVDDHFRQLEREALKVQQGIQQVGVLEDVLEKILGSQRPKVEDMKPSGHIWKWQEIAALEPDADGLEAFKMVLTANSVAFDATGHPNLIFNAISSLTRENPAIGLRVEAILDDSDLRKSVASFLPQRAANLLADDIKALSAPGDNLDDLTLAIPALVTKPVAKKSHKKKPAAVKTEAKPKPAPKRKTVTNSRAPVKPADPA